ncbi:MAG: hypothetical protein CMI54_08315 [Parcubacteria group bacterium]|nr:hypothetical protein [Parcubacteria group bacterium]|tara:strand:- start:1557 stop:2027 length:471 start_codon:yes stop_codon:yes gene_type:complete
MVDAKDMMGVVVFVILFVAVAIGVTDDLITDLTTLTSVNNESFNSSVVNTVVNLANDDFSGTPTVTGRLNGTGLDDGTGMGTILDGNYTINNVDGTINVSTLNFSNGVYNITYDYEPTAFLPQGSIVRTVLPILLIILAIATITTVLARLKLEDET